METVMFMVPKHNINNNNKKIKANEIKWHKNHCYISRDVIFKKIEACAEFM